MLNVLFDLNVFLLPIVVVQNMNHSETVLFWFFLFQINIELYKYITL